MKDLMNPRPPTRSRSASPRRPLLPLVAALALCGGVATGAQAPGQSAVPNAPKPAAVAAPVVAAVPASDGSAEINYRLSFKQLGRSQPFELRGTDGRNDLACRLAPHQLERVLAARFPTSIILLNLAEELSAAQKAGQFSDLQLQSMDRNLNLLTEASGACERIANTPIPYTYRVLMNRTVMVYCLLLPIGLSTSIGWLTPLIATFVAYTFLALDVIGEQIEEPFGTEPNDLALASMCHAIEVSVCELVDEVVRSQAPTVSDYVLT